MRESRRFSYSAEGVLATELYFDGAGNFNHGKRYFYDKSGCMIMEVACAENGDVYGKYETNEDGLISSYTEELKRDGKVYATATTTISYGVAGDITRLYYNVEHLVASGEPIEYDYEIIYSAGVLSQYIEYEEDGSVRESWEWSYDTVTDRQKNGGYYDGIF